MRHYSPAMDSALTTVGLPIALGIIMFGLGLSLTPDDFAHLMTRASKMLRALNEEEPSWRMPVAR